MPSADIYRGVILGTALGDALGLPFEGLSPERVAARLARRPLQHSMLAGRGLLSDDTEHTAMVARALHARAPEAFAAALARQLRRWLFGLPPGLGLATLRSCVRLCLGWSPARSGVVSAGNGPAMRAALLGVHARDDDELVAWVHASTVISHRDRRAEDGARVVARWARALAHGLPPSPEVLRDIDDTTFRERTLRALDAADLAPDAYRRCEGLQRGVSGFIVETIPAALYCWARAAEHPAAAIETAIRLGGDTDTTGAIVGAWMGAAHGARGLPKPWLDGLVDWPLTRTHLVELADALHEGKPPPRQRWVAAFPRNLAMIGLIVGHVGMRLLGR
ncbi:MAG: ADP-ribosylglycohydrolase family protein [Myxococcota bacterium]